jgi:hypothetical protein
MRGEVGHRQILNENALGIAHSEMGLTLRSSAASRLLILTKPTKPRTPSPRSSNRPRPLWPCQRHGARLPCCAPLGMR